MSAFEDQPFLLLRPNKQQFQLLKWASREEATSQASELVIACGHKNVMPATAWDGNRLSIESVSGTWTLVELEW